MVANATDNLGVSKVEFYIDNVLKASDQVSPYNYSLDTLSLTNGSHVIKAKAYDNSGLTSEDSVTITVNNVISDITVPQISNVTVSNITSNSAQITWITDEGSTSQVEYGIGTGYGSTTSSDANLLTSHSQTLVNLSSDTTYHLRVRSKDSAGNEAVSSDISFVTLNPPPAVLTRYEENDPAVSYTGSWISYSYGYYSGGFATYTSQSGATATFSFFGTSVTWITAKTINRGIAKVYIDDVYDADVDLYSSSTEVQQAVYTKTGLDESTHTIKIEVTGTKNPSSSNIYIGVDAFDVN